MSIKDICKIPIQNIADDNCVLFMWWVASQPEEALKLLRAWEFTLKTMTGFTWIKKTKTGKDFFGMGFWTRQQSENCLVAVRGKPKRINAGIRQLIYAENKKHSQKPLEAREAIVNLMGDITKIELFAREEFEGWDCFGNEL